MGASDQPLRDVPLVRAWLGFFWLVQLSRAAFWAGLLGFLTLLR